MQSDQNSSARWPGGDHRSLIERSATLRAQARSTSSPEARADFERMAIQYQRMAARVARRDLHKSTLGDLLYGNNAKEHILESEWISLLRAIGAHDQYAFQTLYVWIHRLVVVLIGRITNDRIATEDAALDVFHDVWQEASQFDPLDDSVIGWIMNKARSRALRADSVKVDSSAAAQKLEPVGDPSAEYSAALWARIAHRITPNIHDAFFARLSDTAHEAEWENSTDHIFCKILARDTQRDRISMLVRLAPMGEYPPHMHAGVEQLHLLEGELWIDGRTLFPGDYNRVEPGTVDDRVWSETGCTCILITSSRDILS
jgi:hypothetical protein